MIDEEKGTDFSDMAAAAATAAAATPMAQVGSNPLTSDEEVEDEESRIPPLKDSDVGKILSDMHHSMLELQSALDGKQQWIATGYSMLRNRARELRHIKEKLSVRRQNLEHLAKLLGMSSSNETSGHPHQPHHHHEGAGSPGGGHGSTRKKYDHVREEVESLERKLEEARRSCREGEVAVGEAAHKLLAHKGRLVALTRQLEEPFL